MTGSMFYVFSFFRYLIMNGYTVESTPGGVERLQLLVTTGAIQHHHRREAVWTWGISSCVV